MPIFGRHSERFSSRAPHYFSHTELAKEDDNELEQLDEIQALINSAANVGPTNAAASRHLEVLALNETRWNSVYLMLRRAMQLMAPITALSASQEAELPYLDELDWTILQKTLAILKPFYSATLMHEGRGASIHRVLPTLLRLKRHLQEFQTGDLGTLRDSFDGGIAKAVSKIDKYIEKAQKIRVYWAAMILHPKFKLSMAKDRPDVRSEFAAFFNANWGGTGETHPTATTAPLPDDYDNWLNSDPVENDTRGDGLDAYLDSERVSSVDNVLEWWDARHLLYPRLSVMARDILSIPASSAECERIFSRCKNTLTQTRNRLADNTFDMLMCLQSWG